jgi:hypothetical protein
MPDDSLNNGRRTLGVIDGTLTQLSLGLIGLAPTLASVLFRPDLVRPQIAAVQDEGRQGVLLAPGPFFVIGLFVALISASLAAFRADGALIAMGTGVASAAGEGQMWQAVSVAAPLFLAALVLGLLFAAAAYVWRLRDRSLTSALRAAQYGLFGALVVLSVAEPTSNLVGSGGENSVFEPAVCAAVSVWTAFFHDRLIAAPGSAPWRRAGAAVTIMLGVGLLVVGTYQ